MKKAFAPVVMLALALTATLMLSHAPSANAAENPGVAASVPSTPAMAAPVDQDRDHDRDDRRAGRERHPHVRKAIAELQEAKKELQSAPHDFGGHRADAVKECDEAIRQLQLALQYDKK